MESARKRKASNATPTTSTSDARSASSHKRIKLLNSNPPQQSSSESPVQKVGFKLLNQLNHAADKTGRSIADAFLELPPRDQFADYYEQTKLPIAIDVIEEKLKKNAYPTVTSLESDFKRMVQNAKEYNMPKSDVYEDAERIRKLVYNFMKINNPAYSLDPTYSSFPTPIPTASTPKLTLTNGASHDPEPIKHESKSREPSIKPRPSTAPKDSEPPSDRKSSAAPSAETGDDATSEEMNFSGKSFQEAQEMIIADCIHYRDDSGLEIFTPFINLPSRKLEDYYRTIRHPVSLKKVQKRVRGQHGRDLPTGITDFKTWDAFENETSWIWRNAKEYNADGSEMYELASELEEHYKTRLTEAKALVEEPAKPSIKIGAAKQLPKSGITLNLSQHRNSPTPGVSVDSEALARQRQMVQAGVNGQQRATPPVVNGKPRPLSQDQAAALPRPPSGPPACSPPVKTVKHEKYPTLSPALPPSTAVQPTTDGLMPPPVARPASGSPFPFTNGISASTVHYPVPGILPPTQVRSYPVSQVLLPSVTISTHPQLPITKAYSLTIPPHPALSHQSTTITLPSTHYYLQIAPTISRELSMGRAYKMFVTLNGTRLTQRDTQFHADSGRRTHVYEGSLASGVNRLEIEVAAAKLDAASSDADARGLDVEKITVFANLTRQS